MGRMERLLEKISHNRGQRNSPNWAFMELFKVPDEIFKVSVELWDTEEHTDIESRKAAREYVWEQIRAIFHTVQWDGLQGEISVSVRRDWG